MADNVTSESITNAGIVFGADDISSVFYPRTKIIVGADGVNDGDVSSSNPMPVSGTVTATGTVTAVPSGTQTVTGTVTSTPSGTTTVTGTINVGNGVFAEDAAHSTGDIGYQVLGVRNDTLAALAGTDGDYTPFQVDANGALYTAPQGTLAVSGTVTATPSGTQTVTGNVTADLGATDNAVLDSIASALAGTLTVTGGGGGTEYSEDAATPATIVGTAQMMERDDALSTVTPIEGDWVAQRATAEGALWVQDFNSDAILSALGGTLTVDNSGNTQPVSGTVTANLGATDNGVLDAIAASVAGTLTVSGTVTATPSGTQTVSGSVTADLGATDNAVLDSIVTNTTAAASKYRNIDANAEDAIKAGAGTLYWLHVVNRTAAIAYLHLYDASTASVTPGSTTPDFTFPVPTTGDTNGAGFTISLGANGQVFSTAITLVVTTTVDGSAGDPGTNGVFVNAGYT